jgi:hypothetical protein
MDTETKATLAEMVIEALTADSERRAAISGEIACFPPALAIPRYYSGATTSAVLSHVMMLAENAGRPLHRFAIEAATWLQEKQRTVSLESPQKFYVWPATKDVSSWFAGGAAICVDDGSGVEKAIDSCLFPSEIEHDWQGYFEFWAVRDSHPSGISWRLILPEEFRGH